MKKNYKRRKTISEINVTPFVDVMLVLLIIFMVTAPLLTAGIKVNLPESTSILKNEKNDPITAKVLECDEKKEKAAELQQAIEQLPDNFREVLTLKIWGELTFAQIADSLHIPANTAASRYRYAIEALRKILKPKSL